MRGRSIRLSQNWSMGLSKCAQVSVKFTFHSLTQSPKCRLYQAVCLVVFLFGTIIVVFFLPVVSI